MKILVVSAADATNLSIANVLKEFLSRGHHVEVYARFTDKKSIRMFSVLKISIHSIEELNDQVIARYDIAFCGTDAMDFLRFSNIYVFAYNFIFNDWPSAGADFMFTLFKNRNMRCKEDCATMPIGVPKNDSPKLNEPQKQFLYIDAGHIPFGVEGKQQIANMLLDICNEFPDYNLIVKPRWLLEDSKNLTHANSQHIYNIIKNIAGENLPSNLVLLNEHLDMQMLIDESTAVITTSVSSYLDAALRERGVLVVGDLSNEDQCELRKNVSLKKDYDRAASGGVLVNYNDVIKYLPKGLTCNKDYLDRTLPYKNGVSSRIVDVVEYIFENFLKYGKYPKIKVYDYETYKVNLQVDKDLTLETLKYRRMKNSIINLSRIFDSIDADIDYHQYFTKLENIYCTFPLCREGYLDLVKVMNQERNNIWIFNQNLLMSDAINQSYLLMAMYEEEKFEEILALSPDKILCTGPYSYYLALIYEKQCWNIKAFKNFIYFLTEASERSYNKYPQEREWGIRIAYHHLFRIYNDSSILPEEFANICIALDAKYKDIKIPDRFKQKAFHMLPEIAGILVSYNPIKAYQCLELYARYNEQHTLIALRKKIKVLEHDNLLLSTTLNYSLKARSRRLIHKILGGIKCIREHGCRYTYRHGIQKCRFVVLNKIENRSIYIIWNTFSQKVMHGYKLYRNVIQKYGYNSKLFLSAQANGDNYIHGTCFKAYTKNRSEIPVFGVYGAAGYKVAKLFDICNIESFSQDEFKDLYNLIMFDSQRKCKLEHMHYQVIHKHTTILMRIEGLHRFNLFSQTMAYLGITPQELTLPQFDYDYNFLKKIFSDNGLKIGKTVLLAPYAKSMISIRPSFWYRLAQALKEHGYTVCTNSGNQDEPAIEDTNPITVPYQYIVPFLEMAGATVGLRSGFYDVINTAKCLKITLYPESKFIRSFVCSLSDSYRLTDMYNQAAQYDWDYSIEQESVLLNKIVNMVISYLECKK